MYARSLKFVSLFFCPEGRSFRCFDFRVKDFCRAESAVLLTDVSSPGVGLTPCEERVSGWFSRLAGLLRLLCGGPYRWPLLGAISSGF